MRTAAATSAGISIVLALVVLRGAPGSAATLTAVQEAPPGLTCIQNALGGTKALASVSSLRITAETKPTALTGARSLPGTREISVVFPEKYRNVYVALSAAILVMPPQFTTMGVPAITMRVMSFILVTSVVAGASWCGASVLAWRLGMKQQSRHVASQDRRTIRIVRFAVVAGQLAAASVLLAGAALLARSHVNLLALDAGMDGQTQTLTVSHNPDMPPALRRELIERTIVALRRAEGVQAAGASLGVELSGAARGCSGSTAMTGPWSVKTEAWWQSWIGTACLETTSTQSICSSWPAALRDPTSQRLS